MPDLPPFAKSNARRTASKRSFWCVLLTVSVTGLFVLYQTGTVFKAWRHIKLAIGAIGPTVACNVGMSKYVRVASPRQQHDQLFVVNHLLFSASPGSIRKFFGLAFSDDHSAFGRLAEGDVSSSLAIGRISRLLPMQANALGGAFSDVVNDKCDLKAEVAILHRNNIHFGFLKDQS